MKVLDENGLEYYHSRIKEELDLINHFRENKIILSGIDIIFLNPNYNDFTNIPLDTLIMTEQGQNGSIYSYCLKHVNNKYVFELEIDNTIVERIYEGNSKSNMTLTGPTYYKYNGAGYGDYAKVTYVNENYKSLLDNIMMINKSF